MSFGQVMMSSLINGTITYILYRIDPKVSLIYVGFLFLMLVTVHRTQFFAMLGQLTDTVGTLGLAG